MAVVSGLGGFFLGLGVDEIVELPAGDAEVDGDLIEPGVYVDRPGKQQGNRALVQR